MKINDLSSAEVAARLRGPGFDLRTGPFVSRVRSPFAELAEAIRLLYADLPVEPDREFADFHLNVRPAGSLWQRLRRRVMLFQDGDMASAVYSRQAALAMLEWGLNACIYNRAHQYVIIHAAVLERDGRALLLSAPPSSGKSTLCTALTFRGWRLLSDELALLRPADGMVAGLARPICLKNESIPLIQTFAPGAVVGPVCRGTHKGRIAHVRPPAESVARVDEPARPAWVLFVRYQAQAAAALTPVRRAPALLRLEEQSFNYSVIDDRSFTVLADMVEQCESYEFTYGDLDEAVSHLDNLGSPSGMTVQAEPQTALTCGRL